MTNPNKTQGDDLELFIKNSWPLPDDIRETLNSGAVFSDADLQTKDFQIEAKNGYAEGVAFRREWIEKTLRVSLLHSKMPLMVHRTKRGDTFAVLRWDDFIGLYEELDDYRKEDHGS